MVWENATPLRVNYWTLIYPVASGTDVNVKVSDVIWVSLYWRLQLCVWAMWITAPSLHLVPACLPARLLWG